MRNTYSIGQDNQNFKCKIAIIFLSMPLNICFGAQKNYVIERVPTTYVLNEIISTMKQCFV